MLITMKNRPQSSSNLNDDVLIFQAFYSTAASRSRIHSDMRKLIQRIEETIQCQLFHTPPKIVEAYQTKENLFRRLHGMNFVALQRDEVVSQQQR